MCGFFSYNVLNEINRAAFYKINKIEQCAVIKYMKKRD